MFPRGFKILPIRLLFSLILIGILLSGLRPFNFLAANKAGLRKDMQGVHFEAPGIIFSSAPLSLSDPSSNSPEFSLQICLKPSKEPNSNLPAILSLWDPKTESLILFGQWKSSLIIRTYLKYYEGSGGFREIGVRDALKKGDKNILTITSTQHQTDIYINGTLGKHYSNYSIIPTFSDSSLFEPYLILGNSVYGKAGWSGEIYGLSVWNHELTPGEIAKNHQPFSNQIFPWEEPGPVANYSFPSQPGSLIRSTTSKGPDLLIPEKYRPFKYSILSPIWRDIAFTKSSIYDILLNILGFIPFGFIFAMARWGKYQRLASRDYLIIIFAAAALSLMIELAQVFLPTRHSQMIDVVCNTIGAFAGGYLFHLVRYHFLRVITIFVGS